MRELEEFSLEELEVQGGELLPARETMALVNLAHVTAINVALAVNAASINSNALAAAFQSVSVNQH
jgi:hypothetical protein